MYMDQLSWSLCGKTASKHDVATLMLHSWYDVLCMKLCTPTLVPSDHMIFFQCSSETFNCFLPNFKCTWIWTVVVVYCNHHSCQGGGFGGGQGAGTRRGGRWAKAGRVARKATPSTGLSHSKEMLRDMGRQGRQRGAGRSGGDPSTPGKQS
jgi:hypothetical protein